MALTRQQFLKKGHGKSGPWMDLVNSEEWDTYGTRTDYLDDPSWLPFFLKQWHLTPPRNATWPVAKFKALRSALRKGCEAVAAGRNLSSSELRALNQSLNVGGRQQIIQGQNGRRNGCEDGRQNGPQIEFVPRSEGWDWVLAQTALSFALVLTHGQADRVKICKNSNCRWVFYDATKARSRCWCNDKVCGNRDRVRRSRARRSG